ncbi:MAG: hypothetical protein Q7K55_08235, partial [Candidatus Levybacteria bacterium]|nr:hypothetical protein [Candidatus Levybacteria bacterium]
MHNLSFEIFVQQDKISRSDWDRLLGKIGTYDANFSIEFTFNLNTVDLFLYSQKDLSQVATKLDGFVLKPTDRQPFTENVNKKIRFKISSKSNILEIKEKEEFNKERVITNINVNVKKIFSFNVYSIKILLKDKFGNEYYSSYNTFANPFSSFEFDFKNSSKIKKRSAPLSLR